MKLRTLLAALALLVSTLAFPAHADAARGVKHCGVIAYNPATHVYTRICR